MRAEIGTLRTEGAWGKVIADHSLRLSERRVLLACGDAVGWLGLLAWDGNHHPHGASLAYGLIGSLLVWWTAAWVNGAYDVEMAALPAATVRSVTRSALVVGSFLAVVAYFSNGTVGRLQWIMSFVFAVILIAIWRICYLRLFTLPVFTRRLLFAGIEPITQDLVQEIRGRWNAHFAVVAFLDAWGQSAEDAQTGGTNDVLALARSCRASEIVASPRVVNDPQHVRYLVDCASAGYRVTSSAMLYEEMLHRVPVSAVDHRSVLDLADGAFADRTFLGIKRLVDIGLATVGLGVLAILAPLIALAILVDSGRPVLYRQQRVGARGRQFTLTKFRTMRQDAESGSPRWACPADDRVTRIGRFLRNSRIDELPQVVQILGGEMSVVGPRPERPEFVHELAQQIPFYTTRNAVKPGLTGWAQINQRYGASVGDAQLKLEYDLYYIRHQSLFLDALIVLRTIGTVLGLRGQ